MSANTTRRLFIQSSAAGLALAATKTTSAKPVSANEKINLGFVGVHGMGMSNMKNCLSQADVNVAYVADIDKNVLGKGLAAAGPKAKGFHDYREMLDQKDLDGVVIATPDHWHGIIAVHALLAEKDVYCQKPLTYTVEEGRAMVKAAKKYKRVTQMGNQIHSTENYHRVAEIVQSGVLGKITLVRIWMARNLAPNGKGKPADGTPPKSLDYDFWLGPAPKRPYNPLRSHFSWRYFWDYAGGHFMDFFCHLTDLVHWGMKVDAPIAVSASGGKYAVDDITETPDTFTAVYDYPGFTLVWDYTDANDHGLEKRGAGVMFHGTEATLHCHYGDYKILKDGKNKDKEIKLPAPFLTRSPGQERQWLDNIKSRKRCECDFEYGHRLTSAGLLANIALRTGRKIYWNRVDEKIDNDADANNRLSREYRKPYVLPDV